MHVNINVFNNYECRHFFDDDVKENLKQKLSIDEIYDISRVETNLVTLFC